MVRDDVRDFGVEVVRKEGERAVLGEVASCSCDCAECLSEYADCTL